MTDNPSLKKYLQIEAELKQIQKKFPDYPEDMFKQAALINKEAGEVSKAVLKCHYEGKSLNNVKSKLIETAAYCMIMLLKIKILENKILQKICKPDI
ncbi:MAG: hypothetical protein ACPH06_03735 [Flavobacteriaceae bacterium]